MGSELIDGNFAHGASRDSVHREKPVFIAGFPVDENRFFPVGNTTQGKPCFHYRDGFAVSTLLISRNCLVEFDI